MTSADDVLHFWFEELDPGVANKPTWFKKDPAFDALLAERFGAAVETALTGGFAAWEDSADPCLALMLLLDQFPRNLFRGQAKAFAGDPRALACARRAVARAFDKGRPPEQSTFFYLPFEHSEDMADQDRAVALFTALNVPHFLDYAHRHRDVIARFGRFPHRNQALGRATTPEEEAWLAEHGGF